MINKQCHGKIKEENLMEIVSKKNRKGNGGFKYEKQLCLRIIYWESWGTSRPQREPSLQESSTVPEKVSTWNQKRYCSTHEQWFEQRHWIQRGLCPKDRLRKESKTQWQFYSLPEHTRAYNKKHYNPYAVIRNFNNDDWPTATRMREKPW